MLYGNDKTKTRIQNKNLTHKSKPQVPMLQKQF